MKTPSWLTLKSVAVIVALAVGLLIASNAVTITHVPARAEMFNGACSEVLPDETIIATLFMLSTSSATVDEARAKWNALDDQTRQGWRQLTARSVPCSITPAVLAHDEIGFEPWYVGAGLVAAIAVFVTVAVVRLAWRSFPDRPRGA